MGQSKKIIIMNFENIIKFLNVHVQGTSPFCKTKILIIFLMSFKVFICLYVLIDIKRKTLTCRNMFRSIAHLEKWSYRDKISEFLSFSENLR